MRARCWFLTRFRATVAHSTKVGVGVQRIIGWGLVALQFALLIALVVVPRRDVQPIWLIVGGTMLLAGAVLGWFAFRALGRALTPTPVPIADAGLRTTGIYAHVRHPIYTAVLLMVFGYVIAIGSWWSAGIAGVLVVFFIVKSRWEDRLLAEVYGEEWSAWAARTQALIPWFAR
jgi:protein-S-isoprenylcysteine O-methyltransferase Ste14